MDLLPKELIADILRRLPPWPLAVCRSVSKDLHAVIDGRGLLLALAYRVPCSLRGIFVNYVDQGCPYFFSQPERATPRIDAMLSFLPDPGYEWREVVHICNGLVLLKKDWSTLSVCNPVTQRWAHLPPRPEGFDSAEHLIFDPTVSLHYDVISFSEVPCRPKMPIDPSIKRSPWYKGILEYCAEEIENLPEYLRAKYDHEGSAEWPPSSYAAQVFSSRTGQWEERTYVREDDVAVSLSDVWSDPWGRYSSLPYKYSVPKTNAVYSQGAFYVHCCGSFIIRLSLLEQKYKVIKTPRLDNVFTPQKLDVDEFLSREGSYRSKEDCLRDYQMEQEYLDRQKPYMHLARSEHGIYYTALCWHQLVVWVLNQTSESHQMPEWELKHKADIRPSFLRHYMREDRDEIETSWSLDHGKRGSNDGLHSGWDSSDDGVINNVDEEDGNNNIGDECHDISDRMNLLGYHPHKEIAFLEGGRFDGFAYYLGSSKLQYLGTFYPVGCGHPQVALTQDPFIYTPCMDDLLPNHKKNSTNDDLVEEEEDGDVEEDEEEEDTNEDEDQDEEDEDTDEDEDQDEEDEDTDEDEDLQVKDEDFKSSESDRDNDEDEDWSLCHLSWPFL